ncbi:MAG: DUF192 domain-containing protein [Phycisphaeraceae bacterium]|nr:DUF192 domain-containing protein [Phycisphaeraceae bacterium]
MATGQLNLSGSDSAGSTRRTLLRACLILAVIGTIFGLAFARGCDDKHDAKVQVVKIGGKTFHLEIADTDAVRTKGLGGRDFIEPDGGMLFVFTQPRVSAFVMRDCPIPIDIIYLDQYGKILTWHQMTPEPPRTEEEKVLSPPYPGAPEHTWSNAAYENRLKQYPSRFPTQFVIELKGGTIPSLNLKEGDKIDLPLAALKSRAK